MELILCFMSIVFGFIPVSIGFLLDSTTPAMTLGSSVLTDQHFLTLIELLSDEKQHRYALEKQIATLEQTVATSHKDKKLSLLEQYVKQLESRLFTVEHDSSQKKNETCVCVDNEARSQLSNATAKMNTTNKVLEQIYNDLKTSFNLKNQKFRTIDAKISGLLNLKSINQTKTLQSLQSEVTTLHSQTNQLLSNSNARGQDFMALYNKTLTVEANFQNVTKQLREDLTNSNTTIFLEISRKTKELQTEQNIIKLEVLSKSSTYNRKVAITACTNSSYTWHIVNTGDILLFPNIRSMFGFNNTTPLTYSGKFVCYDEGIYMITTTLAAMSTNDALFRILKNNLKVVEGHDEYSRGVHTSTVVATVEMKQNDTISVKILNTVRLYKDYSCLTIIKVA